MKKFTTRTKVIILGLFIFGMANMNMFADYWAGADHALIREMRLVGKPNYGFGKYQENLDEVVLKHIPLGTSANAAMEICQKNGFKTNEPKGIGGSLSSQYPSFNEYIYCSIKETRWYLIFTDEYRVIVYLKNNQVGMVEGRFFVEIIF